ncbi:MAG: TIGR00296 family protein [Crenarchaeota archaeon]|nr:TIGR00296 family protein [Thermoproteota archaeon]MDW8033687.1 TIGR00296 family protein [Nitrososphaerota archaeon]
MDLTLEEGELLVKLARRAIEKYLEEGIIDTPPADLNEVFYEPCGVFVTLNKIIRTTKHEQKELRGCIGFPEPVKPLVSALIEAAVAAAFEDPRFPPVTLEELNSIVIDVSVLTPPKPIEVEDRRELPKMIKIGRDGLIVERGFNRGLLLPQVAVEEKWDAETFLSYTCLKAGLSPGCWHDKKTRVYSFQAIVFEETSPNGTVRILELGQ